MKRNQVREKTKSSGKIINGNFRVKKSKFEFLGRKRQIIKLVCHQLTSKEIGEKLGLSIKTVEVHRFQIFKQIKAKNNVGVALYAIKNGIYKIK